jgi:hypothetical protein
MKDANKIMVSKLEGKRPVGRPRYRWKYNIKMDLEGLNSEGQFVWLDIESSRLL